MIYLFALIAGIAGILAGIEYGNIPIILVVAAAIFASLTAIVVHAQALRLAFVALSIGLIFLSRSASLNLQNRNQQSSKQAHTYSGIIINSPQTQKGALSIIVDHVKVKENDQKWLGKIQASVAPYNDLQYGDQVQLTGKMQLVNPNSADSYQKYLYFHQIYGTLNRPSLVLIAHNQGNPLLAKTYQFQRTLQKSVIRVFPKDEAGLLLGIVLGLQQPLSKNFSQALSNTSTTHIIVASGFNASIVIGIFLSLAGKFKRRTAISLALIALSIYVALSGFNPSMIRAAIMAGIALSAQGLGRQRDALRLLIITALAMLIINPLWLFDISFQLSFAATAGIVLIEKKVSSLICHLPNMVREVTSTTIAAQIFTFPIISFNFGSIALLGMIANLLVLWLVPLIMAIGAIAVLAVWLLPFSSLLCALVAEPLLWYVKQVIIWSAGLPLSSLHVQMTGMTVTAYYLVLIIIVWKGRYALAG